MSQELRTIIVIDEELCIGCGLCVDACHEGAIALVDGTAKLMFEHYCDGLGDCLPVCPTDAISFEERMAAAYDETAAIETELRQWPVQIKLVSPSAPFFAGADVLVAADCTAFSYGAFHRDFMAGRVTLVGCPKLDAVDYAEKLSEIMRSNDIASVTVARMSVPCCGGLERAVREAVAASGTQAPIVVRTIGTDGSLLE